MKLLRVTVVSPSGAEFSTDFFPDLNILTGKNGSGKTRALKLAWYVVSGNVEHAVREIPFTSATVETTEYSITIKKSGDEVDSIQIEIDGEVYNVSADDDDESPFDGGLVANANAFLRDRGSSLFFPTFRRIEGGFSIPLAPARNVLASGSRSSNLNEAMSDLARRMTNADHTFISSISTTDIVQFLNRKYADMADRSNQVRSATSQEIIEQIKFYQATKRSAQGGAELVLDEIKRKIEHLDSEVEGILAPYNAIGELVRRLFHHTGIRMGARLSFGDATQAINSEQLSAGEKQMLGFVCYNAFLDDGIIFIDEPELSLHVDWQRQLFSILLSQGTSNQFVIATHSPFIYAKFPDREIALSRDRGDQAS